MPIPVWAEFMLNNLSPGQLQSGTYFKAPVKQSVPVSPEAPRGFKIVQGIKGVRGTGIPASTMSRFRSGEWTPRQATLDKLHKYYNRYMYQFLKSSGATSRQARRFYNLPPDKIISIAQSYRAYVEMVAKNKDVSLDYVLWGFTQSERIFEDWEEYIRSHGYRA